MYPEGHEVLAHRDGVRPRGEAPLEADEALLSLAFHVVERIAETAHGIDAPVPQGPVTVPPRGLDEKPGAGSKGGAVEGGVEREGSPARSPPIVDGTVLRPGAIVVGPPGKPKLDVFPGRLSPRVSQVPAEVVLLRIIIRPPGVSLLAVGVDVGDDPPLVASDPRIARGEVAEVGSEVPKEARADRLVRVAPAEEAHGLPALPEPKAADRPSFPRAAEDLALVVRNPRGFDESLEPLRLEGIGGRRDDGRVVGHA